MSLVATPLAGSGALAARFAEAGRVVPGLVHDADLGWRAVWWPLPATDDRDRLAALCTGTDAVAVASAVGAAVDREVRSRLDGARLAPVRRGRRDRGTALVDAWLGALASGDGVLDPQPPDALAEEFAQELAAWVGSGLPTLGTLRLCLRVHEPSDSGNWSVDTVLARGDRGGRGAPERGGLTRTAATWRVELLLQATDDPSLRVPAADVWAGGRVVDALARPGQDPVVALLAGLGKAVRLAPELEPLLDEATPCEVRLTTTEVHRFCAERAELLAQVGIGLLLPSWWAGRARPGLRVAARSGRAATKGTGAVTSGGLGLDRLVGFTWQAALGDAPLSAAELRALAAAKEPLVRLRGQWVEVDPAELGRVVALAGKRGEARAGALVRAALGVEPLAGAGDVVVTGVTATGWLGHLLDDAVHTDAATPVPTPPGFGGTLRPYQERGVGWLAFLGRLGLGACLADDMGLGKTAQLLALLLAEPVDGPTLVLAPVSVLGNWQHETARFTPGLRVVTHHGPGRHRDHDVPFAERAAAADVVLSTYSIVARDIEHLAAVPWARLVLDEAQLVKNADTVQARAVRRLHADRRIALTGTPVENRLAELWSIMTVLNPGLLGTAHHFRERFALPIERDHDDEAAATLRRAVQPFVLRRVKTDRRIIDDLPDKIESTEYCTLTREQATLYQATVDDALARIEEADGIERRGLVLGLLTRLKQVCNHPAHLLGDGSALPGRSGKLRRTEELLDEIVAAGERALCFTQFAEWGTMLRPYLARRLGVEVSWLHGRVPRPKRDAMVAAFQAATGPAVLLVSLRAGGTGLNLTGANHVIHLDRWWNPAVEDQATDRAFRIGQTRNVWVRKLVCTGTVEERIDAVIASKRDLAARIVGAGEDWLTDLSTADLRAAVALGSDAVGTDD